MRKGKIEHFKTQNSSMSFFLNLTFGSPYLKYYFVMQAIFHFVMK